MAYDPDKGEKIAVLHGAGLALRKIGKLDGLPSYDTIAKWRVTSDHFSDLLARARVCNAEGHAEDALEASRKALVYARRGEIARAKAVVAAYDKLAAQQRWHAERTDPKTWAPLQKHDIDARIAVLTAYLDMSGPPPPLHADATVEASSMPHVAAPDDVRDEG